jgi:peptidoglycan/LPS O-acetylase OafA/YrhL
VGRRGLHLRIESSSALTSVKSTNRYYPEIDGLRAVAVILVILYHFGYSDFTGGFVGVDVFFVISGYLITGLLIDSPAHHGVGVAAFYIRRIKRLAPALLFFLLVCLACGYALLSPGDYTSLAASSLFASVGASNFYFFYHTGYFDPSAQSLPLLHTWSLAIEEQFYLVWPISLFLLRKLCKGRSGGQNHHRKRTHAVVAFRIEKATIARNMPFLAALCELMSETTTIPTIPF